MDLVDIKIASLVNFPAEVRGGTGIGVAKDGHVYTFDIDYGEVVPMTSVANLATTFVLLHETVSNTYFRISLTNLKTALGIP